MAKISSTSILVVEDRLEMRTIIKTMLRHIGFNTIVDVTDGVEALESLEEMKRKQVLHRLGMIIADWNMPNMTGLELLEAVRANDNYKDLPFLLVTSENEHDYIIRAVAAGVTDYIVKPFNAKILEEKVLSNLRAQ